MVRSYLILSVFGICAAGTSLPVSASEAERLKSVAAGIEFLRQRGQAEDGSFGDSSPIAITALCASAILKNRPEAISDPVIVKALTYLEKNVQKDGGIYAVGSKYRNYETCVAVQAFAEANRKGRYDKHLSDADAFLKHLQWDEGEGIEPTNPAYGGSGYGKHNRPDLSNTAFMIEALRDLGNESDAKAIQKALKFVSRTQNLESPHNDTEHAAKVGDGGFYYTPAAGGQSQAMTTPNGGLRSYGSMSYAGLKSMIYAGVDSKDPRVVAVMNFIRAHYTLDNNPGMGQSGLYYYYHTLAKALSVADVKTLRDAEGVEHSWRREVVQELVGRQQTDGSWLNTENSRWQEGDRELVTAYALLTLAYCGD